ncbi:MAG TPA: hypothetical protein VJM33_19065, partial [Microthrixaceae bacterium]|nr:hypothetical protein [Microthrixaceae bacterium]
DLGGHEIGDSSQAHFEQLVIDRDLPLATHGALRAGDATFHAGWTLHSTAPNPTKEDRPVMTVIYFADGTRILDDVSDASRAFDLTMWLSGCEPGGPAAGPGNPVLWP